MDINAGLRSPNSHKVISDISCLQGGGRREEESLRSLYCQN